MLVSRNAGCPKAASREARLLLQRPQVVDVQQRRDVHAIAAPQHVGACAAAARRAVALAPQIHLRVVVIVGGGVLIMGSLLRHRGARNRLQLRFSVPRHEVRLNNAQLCREPRPAHDLHAAAAAAAGPGARAPRRAHGPEAG